VSAFLGRQATTVRDVTEAWKTSRLKSLYRPAALQNRSRREKSSARMDFTLVMRPKVTAFTAVESPL